MEQARYEEMSENLCHRKAELTRKELWLFGHCEASLTLAEMLLEGGFVPAGILDNSKEKQGQAYKGLRVFPPEAILSSPAEKTCVLIVTRFYEAMHAQLRKLGFRGEVVRLTDDNTYAEYSLSAETRERKYERLRHGKALLRELKERFDGAYLVFCPLNALGDIYFCMSYLPAFAAKNGIEAYAVCVPSAACAAVARLFGAENVVVLAQKELDAAIQAVIYTQDEGCFIAHQDRPYVVDLHRALHLKQIPLETIYRCGVFGLPKDTVPAEPTAWTASERLSEIKENRAVILSPYAKSVPALPEGVWEGIIKDYRARRFQVWTNISEKEKPLPGTEPLRAELSAMRSILERAGTFIGLRSGLCDVIRTAKCRKVALYPEYHYCDTKWKAIDMYAIEGFENIVVKEDFSWKMS